MDSEKSDISKIDIEELIETVDREGSVRTGVNIYNSRGVLLLNGDTQVRREHPLRVIERWGREGDPRSDGPATYSNHKANPPRPSSSEPSSAALSGPSLQVRLQEISELREEARHICSTARDAARQINDQILKTGGAFDVEAAEECVAGLIRFLDSHERSFLYLSQEIASYDHYLYNHSVHVCILGTAVLKRLNMQFSREVSRLQFDAEQEERADAEWEPGKRVYSPEEVLDFSLACFLHDIGKMLVPREVLDKPGELSEEERAEIRRHSGEYGLQLLRQNGVENRIIRNTVLYHHAPLYAGETACYPEVSPDEVPPYAGVAKLADVYDAMTSRRCYKEALNPGLVVAQIFRKYAEKNQLLRYLLHSFVHVVGLYPAGSFLYLQDGRLVYVLDSEGPIVQPLTDEAGNPLSRRTEPFDLRSGCAPVDRDHPFERPIEAFHLVPEKLRS